MSTTKKITKTTKKRTLLKFSYLPLNILTDWERASLTSNFFADFLTTTHEKLAKDESYKNTISTMINEIIEYSVKHSTFKNYQNHLSISIEDNTLYIDINCNILKTHFYLLKALMKDLNKNKNQDFLDNYNFNGEFSNFVFCLHSLINNYNASIKIHSKKSFDDPIKSVNLKLKFLLKEENIYDY
ncbi:hypothetical protein DID76_02225 [Candidatus Marinamargulisbacteria bacterium SCGC AG-414-C22]|nr:hypothetical protein DID76_02225 [Candidatus Marinamargulisbacteria bacterium SCGC AG-414-C22]